MRFLLSIHDVWPGNFQLVATYLERLRSLGCKRVALLVVPDYHGKGLMDQNPEFLDWLNQESSKGLELFLHGYRHLIPERIKQISFQGKRNRWGHWVNKHWVNHEAEFCGLPEIEKVQLLRSGLGAFQASKLKCAGFVAPTWHGTPTNKTLHGEGFEFVESRFFVQNLRTLEMRFAPPLAWTQSEGKLPNLVGGLPWLKTLLSLPLIKVAIHPGDLQGSGANEVLTQVMEKGRESSYGELFGTQQPQE